MEWIGDYPPVGSPYEPICGIVVDDVLHVSPRGYGLPLGVFNDVFRVGGAVFRQEGVDVVSGGDARSGRVLSVWSGVPFAQSERGRASERDLVGRVGEVADGVEDVVPVGQVVTHQALDLVNEVRRGAGLLVAGEDVEHGIGNQLRGSDECAPRLVRVVELPVVGANAGDAVDEKRQIQPRPIGEVVLAMAQGLEDVVGALGFVGLCHVGGDVRLDVINVVASRDDGRWGDVAGGADEWRVLRGSESQFDENTDGGLGVERWPAVVSVDDCGFSHDVVGSLGDFVQRLAELLVNMNECGRDAAQPVAD